jgi:hypothetical protein
LPLFIFYRNADSEATANITARYAADFGTEASFRKFDILIKIYLIFSNITARYAADFGTEASFLEFDILIKILFNFYNT